MYVVTGNDDVFALNAKTGEILWERWSGIDQNIIDGLLRLAQPRPGNGRGHALPRPARRQCRGARYQDRQGGVEDADRGTGRTAMCITSAPLYYDGIVYSGIAGGEFGMRGRLTALDAKTGKILWRSYTVPAPGEVGSDTWPRRKTIHGDARRRRRSGTRRRSIPNSGLIYFATGNCGPDYDGSIARGRQSVLRLHHGTQCQDRRICLALPGGAPRPLGLRRGEPGRPVRHRDQRAAAQRHRRGRQAPAGSISSIAPTGSRWSASRSVRFRRSRGKRRPRRSPIPIGDATVPPCAQPLPGYDKPGCIFEPFWDEPRHRSSLADRAARTGRRCLTVRIPAIFYVPGTDPDECLRRATNDTCKNGQRYVGGTQAAPIGSPFERHLHRDRQPHQQDRLAATDAISHGRWRRFDRYRRRSAAARRAGRQFRGRSTPRPAISSGHSKPASAPMHLPSCMRWTARSTSRSSPAATRFREAPPVTPSGRSP